MNDQLLTIADVARYTKLSRSKVYELCQSKKMPHLKIGKSVRVKGSRSSGLAEDAGSSTAP